MKLLISTGEVSGDLQGSLLIKALKTNAEKRKIELDIIALGGKRMREAGAQLISNTSSIGAIGFSYLLHDFLKPLLINFPANLQKPHQY